MKNVIAIVRLMFTPMSAAASRSAAVERIARPIRVRPMNSWSAIMSADRDEDDEQAQHRDVGAADLHEPGRSGKIWGELVLNGP